MSTRCQVEVFDQIGESRWLYHHWDGYPTSMLPLFVQAWEKAQALLTTDGHDQFWQLGRAGKVASFLCHADPMGFEVEGVDHQRGDVDWVYRIFIVGDYDQPQWEVGVSHGARKLGRYPLHTAAEYAANMEAR